MPDQMNKKLFAHLERAGMLYEQAGRFDEKSIKEFGKLYRYTKAHARRNQFMKKLGLTNIFWNSMLKKSKVYDKRFDKPFGS